MVAGDAFVAISQKNADLSSSMRVCWLGSQGANLLGSKFMSCVSWIAKTNRISNRIEFDHTAKTNHGLR